MMGPFKHTKNLAIRSNLQMLAQT